MIMLIYNEFGREFAAFVWCNCPITYFHNKYLIPVDVMINLSVAISKHAIPSSFDMNEFLQTPLSHWFFTISMSQYPYIVLVHSSKGMYAWVRNVSISDFEIKQYRNTAGKNRRTANAN